MLSGLLLAKILYFCTGLASVGWNRFQTLYFLNIGIPPGQIGELKSIGLALKFIGEPFWCFVADLTDPKLIFILSLFASIGSLEILRNTENVTYWTIILVKLVRTATAPQATLTIMASMELIKGTQEGYGQQRLYGSLAWGIGAYMVGILIDRYGTNSMFYFTYFFQIVSLAIVFRYLPTRALNSKSQEEKNSNESLNGVPSPSPKSGRATDTMGMLGELCNTGAKKMSVYMQELRQFFHNRCCRVILVNALIYGVVMQVCDTYLYIAVEEDYHANKAYAGLLVMASTLSCIPIFYYSKKVIILYGHSNMIMVSHIALVLRLLLLSLIRPGGSFSMHGILVVQLLHGFNYALFWAASVDAVFHQSPKHLGTSCMAALNLFYQSLGFGVGSLFWGYVYEYLGGMNWSFYLCAIAMSATAAIHFYYHKQDIDVAMAETKSGSDADPNEQEEFESMLNSREDMIHDDTMIDSANGHRDIENRGETVESDTGTLYRSPGHGNIDSISQQRKHSRDYDFRV